MYYSFTSVSRCYTLVCVVIAKVCLFFGKVYLFCVEKRDYHSIAVNDIDLIFIFVLFMMIMKRDSTNIASVPSWFVAVLVVMALPLIFYPYLLAHYDVSCVPGVDYEMLRFLIYILPIYVILSQWLSYKMYVQWRALVWILQFLLLAVYAACVLIVL